MIQSTNESQNTIWVLPVWMIALLCVVGAALIWGFYDGLALMVHMWGSSEEYGYGYIIPVITAFFIWQKKNELAELPFTGSWLGVLVMLMGLFLLIAGELASLFIITQYAFLVSLFGLVLALTGWQIFKVIGVPLAMLVFMIPLPNFLYQNLSSELQLISSELGVAIIRMFGISVYLEGNVIDLGAYKLQVVEACSGLRYLFPLTSLAFIAAYIYRGAFWKKAVIFLSSVPITIFMNSFRIGVIGVLVEYGGPEQAEGFLHYFEGWIVFMGCIAILLLGMWLLTQIGREKVGFSDVFALELPESLSSAGKDVRARVFPASLIVALPVVLAIALTDTFLSDRAEVIPDRLAFSEFPEEFSEWEGKSGKLEQVYLDLLKLNDYVIADYTDNTGKVVNYYSAYYASQRKGESAHSPRSCIPGGGWQIKDIDQLDLEGVVTGGAPLVVNRLVIKKADTQQLIYYWFQGRGRNLTNEYLVKWFLFWDSLTRSRTDGALVRLTAYVGPDEDIADADRRLTTFAKDVSGFLDDFIPD